MGLRLREGVDLARVTRRTGLPLDALIDRRAVAQLPELIRLDGDHLSVTEAGMLLLDAILPRVVRADEIAAA